MKKYSLFGILIIALALLSFSAYAAPGVSILNNSFTANVNLSTSTQVSSQLTIANTGTTINDSGTVSFSGTDLSESSGTKITINIASKQMNNASNDTFPFSITLAPNQKAGIYTGTLTATINANSGTAQSTIPFTITVLRQADSVNVQSVSISEAISGVSAAQSFTITNLGNSDFNALVSVTSLTHSDGSTLLPSQISSPNFLLTYGQTRTVTLTVSPALTQKAGTYTGNVSVSTPDGITSSPVTIVVVNQSNDISVTRSPTGSTWYKTISSTVSTTFTVKNTGNTNLTNVQMVPTTSIPGASVIASPASLVLARGVSQDVTVTLSGVSGSTSAGTYANQINLNAAGSSASTNWSIVVSEPVKRISLPSKITLGDSNSDRNQTVQTSFSIVNSGSDNVNLMINATSVNPAYQIQITPAVVSGFGPGGSVTITVTGYIPASKSAGEGTIGAILVKDDTNTIIQTIPLTMIARSILTIDYPVKVYVNGSSNSVSNGGTVDDSVQPGDNVEVSVQLKNNYGSNNVDDNKLSDVSATVTFEGIDDGSDIEKDKDYSDIRAGKTKKNSFVFTVPNTGVDEGTYTIRIHADGHDDNGAVHSDDWTIYVDVNRKDHDLKILDFSFDRAEAQCGSIVYLTAAIRNEGSTYEDQVALAINNSVFNVGIFEPPFELEKYDNDRAKSEFRKTYAVLVPKTALGSYRFLLQVYYDTSALYDYKYADLTVTCGNTTTSTPATGGSTGTVTPTQPSGGNIIVVPPQQSQPSYATPAVSQQQTGLSSDLMTILLVIGSIILLGIIILIVVKLVMK